jgi:hypothetical protein
MQGLPSAGGKMNLHQSLSPSLKLAVELDGEVVKSRVELSTERSQVFECSEGAVRLVFQLFMHAHRASASA